MLSDIVQFNALFLTYFLLAHHRLQADVSVPLTAKVDTFCACRNIIKELLFILFGNGTEELTLNEPQYPYGIQGVNQHICTQFTFW